MMQRSATAPYSPHRPMGGRVIGLVLVVLMHLALADALVSALARRAVTVAPVVVETEIVADTPPVAPPTPPAVPPSPNEPAPPPKIVAPARPPAPHRSAITVEPKPPSRDAEPAPTATIAPPMLPPPAPAMPVQVMPHLDLAKSREPEYPPQSRQLGEQGSVVLQVLVGTDGAVLDTKLVQSSGYARLDQAALRDIKASYRFVPGTVDGKPEPMWYTIKYNWKLR